MITFIVGAIGDKLFVAAIGAKLCVETIGNKIKCRSYW